MEFMGMLVVDGVDFIQPVDNRKGADWMETNKSRE